MKKLRIEMTRSNSDRRREALIAAGVVPSHFGQRKASRVHRDRKKALARGERKHRQPWV